MLHENAFLIIVNLQHPNLISFEYASSFIFILSIESLPARDQSISQRVTMLRRSHRTHPS